MKMTRLRIDVSESFATLEVWTDEPDKKALVATDWVDVTKVFQKATRSLPGKSARSGGWYMADPPESDAPFVMACEWRPKS